MGDSPQMVRPHSHHELGQKGSKTILVVDDEEYMREYLNEVLTRQGYACECFSNSLSALSYLAQAPETVDLLLTDISMPGMDGIDLLRTVRTVSPELPVILISGLYELALALDAMRAGATDYLHKPVRPSALLEMMARHLRPGSRSEEMIVREALRKYLDSRERNLESADEIVEIFDVLGLKRYETMQHSRRVAAYSLLLARQCNLDDAQLEQAKVGALLHDIGKIAIPHNILTKPDTLSPLEREVMQMHPRIGWELLSAFPDLQGAADIVYCHHERFDGQGYPRALGGESIPFGARIFSIADSFDAITSHRPYHQGEPTALACERIAAQRGTQFAPDLVERFLRLPETAFQQIREKIPEREEAAVLRDTNRSRSESR